MTTSSEQKPIIKVIGFGEEIQNTLTSLQTIANVEVQRITGSEELEKLKKSSLDPSVNILMIIAHPDGQYMDWANDIARMHKNPERLSLAIIITDNTDSKHNESDFDAIFHIKEEDLSAKTSPSNKVFTLVNEFNKISSLHGYINIDLEDVKTCLKNTDNASLITATASGNNRAKQAITKVLNQLNKDHIAVKYAKNILLNIYSGHEEANMVEISVIIDYVTDFCQDKKVAIIWGVALDESLRDELCITLIASSAEQEFGKPIACTSLEE
jgi:cell division GTPase FtsZ